ncbi:tyrosine-protein kinase Tec-like [Corticium candelabrum]|uniref:tyrosine-protein kinase Tec-like n=1 Tax=Corticium candelabrum TaxID=121492 RepID=UPI002E2643CA|nr:tyrosine-protein kinase Tec-like [Corticium candelabrum]
MADYSELKVSLMTKRSQGKSRMGPVNYKQRVFVLTPHHLSYYEGTVEKRGTEKGCIDIQTIRVIEAVDEVAIGRPFTFQVVHDGLTLYIIASDQCEQEEWIGLIQEECLHCQPESLSRQYHPGVWNGKKWTCCGHSTKIAHGCRPTFIMTRMQANDGQVLSNMSNSLPALPSVPCMNGDVPDAYRGPQTMPPLPVPPTPDTTQGFEVMAIYDYRPTESGDLPLNKGQRVLIIDESRDHWWNARNEYGQEGFVPSNYVRKVGLESEEWFHPTLNRVEAEGILKSEGKEGCFVVRDSSRPGMYTLSVCHADVVRHYHIKCDEQNKYYISDRHRFNEITQLVEYHQHNGGGLVTRLRNPPSSLAPSTTGFGHELDRWEINRVDLELGRELGSGQFGRVVEGIYRGQTPVAVKMMKDGSMLEEDFIDEAKTMKNFQHDNLVQLYGVCIQGGPLYLVTELMINGCLLNYVRKNKRLAEQTDIVVYMCTQVASGMKYLEERQFIHRDLAARNCLVGERNRVKVADFGLARHVWKDDEYTATEGTKFPIKWAAPEVINYAKFSSKSDVWSFSVLMWELFTGGKTPYPTFSNAQVLQEVLDGYRLEKPKSCPIEVYKLMQIAWRELPEERPSFEYLYRCLKDMGEDYSEE